MYSASASFNTAIKSNTRIISWTADITTTGGTTHSVTSEELKGTITRSISSQSLKIGTAYASALSAEVVLSGVSRYELYGGTITVKVSVTGAADVIPMGTYTISEAMQSFDHITIKAYDNMVLFDSVNFAPTDHLTIQSPYQWLSEMCTACSVTLGSTSADISALPNGARKTGFADVVTDVKTWRDVLGYLCAYLGSYAYIGRDGKLYLGVYGSNSADTVPASFRYSSNLSDYRTTYDGLYGTYKDGAVQEYVSNTNSGGLVLDIGVNPFLQFSNDTNRQAALQEIIDAWDGVYYIPFKGEMPLVPTYDPGDVLTFTGNQADQYDYGAITEITYTIGGKMSVTCSGDNPRLASAQDRFTKSLEGLGGDYSNGQEIGGKSFWLLHVTNDSAITVSSTEIELTEIEWEQTTYGQNVEMIVTIAGTLSTCSTVSLRVVVDDDTDLQMEVVEEKTKLGERSFHCSNPQKIYGEGTHTAKVYMTCTDDPLLWSDLG